MAAGWREREEQWRRFHDWESARLRDLPDDLASALAWMWSAWETARRADPDWQSERSAEEHWRHLGEIRAALGQAGRGA
jgi:hypothetical protein